MQVSTLNIRTAIARYRKEFDNPVEAREAIKIANGYMQFLMTQILKGEEVTLPAKMGTAFIEGTKRPLSFTKSGIPRLPPNWGATKRLWDKNPEAKLNKKIVYCLNEETNGVVYKVKWSRDRVPIENKLYYSFRITKPNKTAVHKSIKQGKEYIIKS